jgi:hypothetical protein
MLAPIQALGAAQIGGGDLCHRISLATEDEPWVLDGAP